MLRTIMLGAVAISLFSADTHAQFYHRAPDSLPGLLPEMRNPAYWIARMENPDEVIMTVAQIQRMNDRYIARMKDPGRFEGIDPNRVPVQKDLDRWPGRYIIKPDLSALSPTALAETVKTEISHDNLFMRGQWMHDVEGLEHVESQSFGNILGIEYAGWELDELEREMAADLVPGRVTPRSAVTVRDALLRAVPTIKGEHVGLMDNGETRWDVWNMNIVRIGARIQVLHTSRTGLYVFALTDDGYGWIRSEDVAFGNSAANDPFRSTADFAICTGDIVPFYTDESCTVAAGFFRMGDRLPLAAAGNTRVVLAPWRDSAGMLQTVRVHLKADAEVNAGYLPYTRRNIVDLSFRMLDNTYDWTGGWLGRNHETWIRDMFACFGFNLPFNAELFTFYGDNTRVVLPSEGKAAQYKAILANEPFVTIQTCGGGHSQLYLGEYNGEPVVLDTHGYAYEENGVSYKVRRLSVGDMSLPTYFLQTPFTFCEMMGE